MPAISTKLLSLMRMGNQSVTRLCCWLMKTKLEPSSHPDGSHMLYSTFSFQLSDIFKNLLYQISNSPPLLFFLFYFPCPFCFFGSDLHAVQCGAGAAHTAGPEAALLRQGPVAQGQQLTAQPQVLPAQPWLKATLGVLSEQLAASADVLSSELWERRRAVSIVPGEGTKWHNTHTITHNWSISNYTSE